MIALLERLSLAKGVSGSEDEVRTLIKEEIIPYAEKIKTDNLGNLIAFKKGRSSRKTVMVAAHMDEVGFLIDDINDDGTLHFAVVGGCDDRTVYGKRVRVGKEQVLGVVGAKPIHQRSKAEREKAYTVKEMIIDIGTNTKEDAEKLISLGDIAVYESSFKEFGTDFIKGKALDNRVGCAAAIAAMKKTPALDTYFVFTVQEEVGLRGANAAAYGLKPDFAIVVDTTTAADFTGVDKLQNACSLGQGTVIFLMENSTYYKKSTVKFAVDTAKATDISYQHKNVVAGGLDAGAIHTALSGIETVSIATPCRYLHSPACVIRYEDFECTAKLLQELLQTVENHI